ncbi:MAG: transglutaminase family protein [bacterium]|nr:transglutaminase family protein [bacterium]MDE0418913.1 transglutaminase family protein [bacterium]
MTRTTGFEVTHHTRYRFSEPASGSVLMCCLKPCEDRGQELRAFSLQTRPESRATDDVDCFGNHRHVLSLLEKHDQLEIEARSVVVPAPDPVLPADLGENAWERLHAASRVFEDWEWLHPTRLTCPSASLTAFVERHAIAPGADPLAGTRDLSTRLHRILTYVPGSTSTQSTIEDVLATGQGVCQDYAHLMIAITRSWGIPSRYVSGFLYDDSEEGGYHTTHAWVECRFPDVGWTGFDPTNDSVAGALHVRIAAGRDFSDVSPTRGILLGGCRTTLDVDVRIRPAGG